MHILKHSFFLSAGSIIHSLSDEQDIRRMGGLQKILPFTYVMVIIGSLALAGFPFLTGFYSKDVILEVTYAKYNFIGVFSFWLGSVSASITAFYSFKLIYMVFLCNPNSFKKDMELVSEAPYSMSLPLIVLSIFSLFLGFLTKDVFIGFGSPFWNNSIFIMPVNSNILDSEFIPIFVKWTPFFLSLFGCSVSVLAYYFLPYLSLKLYADVKLFRLLYTFFNKKWFFDRLQNEFVASFLLKIGFVFTYKFMDKGFLESYGPEGLSRLSLLLSEQVSNLQSGKINHYAFFIFVSLLVFISFNIVLSYVSSYLDIQIYILILFCIFFSR